MWLGRGRGCLRWDWCNPEVDQRNQENALEQIFHGFYIFDVSCADDDVALLKRKKYVTSRRRRKEKAYCDVKRWQTWLQKSIRWGSGPQRPTVQLLVISEMRHKYIYSIFHVSLLNHGLIGNKLLLLSLKKGGFFFSSPPRMSLHCSSGRSILKVHFFIGPKNDSIQNKIRNIHSKKYSFNRVQNIQ